MHTSRLSGVSHIPRLLGVSYSPRSLRASNSLALWGECNSPLSNNRTMPWIWFWHYYKFTLFNVVSYFGCFQPFVVGNVPLFVQYHPPIFDFPKQTCPILAAQGDKIQSCLRIIVSLKTDTTAMVFCRIIGHFALFYRNTHTP